MFVSSISNTQYDWQVEEPPPSARSRQGKGGAAIFSPEVVDVDGAGDADCMVTTPPIGKRDR